MRRVLFNWRGIEFHSYPVLLYLGLLAGLVAANPVAHSIGLDARRVFIAQIVLIPFALLGARLLHVVLHWRWYRSGRGRIFRSTEGGGDMVGGLPVALLVSWPLLRLLDLPFWSFWDVTTFTIFVGMFITRFGCLLNGCCGGRPTKSILGLELGNVEGEVCRRIPMQLIEASWTLAVLGLALWLAPGLGAPGTLFLVAIAVYSTGRVLLDPARERRYSLLGPVTVHQGIYGAVLIVCLTCLTIFLGGT